MLHLIQNYSCIKEKNRKVYIKYTRLFVLFKKCGAGWFNELGSCRGHGWLNELGSCRGHEWLNELGSWII